MREKLIELLKQFEIPIMFGNIEIMKWTLPTDEIITAFADHLIANGVTLAEQLASSSKYLASSEWIPVTERLPEPLTQVLSYGHGCFEVNMVDGGVWDNEYYSEYSVTHWMPLPEAPKGESK